jgi:hypothetical protein
MKVSVDITKIEKLDRIIQAAKHLSFLNQCELEGLQSGQPTSQQWNDAFEELDNALEL